MNITARTKLCLIIGDPVEDSLSPQLHNAGYEQLGLTGEFVYAACRVTAADLPAFVSGARAMHVQGFGCKMPHKQAVPSHLDDIDATARAIGAVNTVVNERGRLKGYNTDWLGITAPLQKITDLKGKHVALLGAGGAARAAAYGVAREGATLTVYNRTVDKARQVADQFGGSARSLDDIAAIGDADVIINATAVGLPLSEDATPLPQRFITKRHIVFDIVYAAGETRLLREAKQQGARTIPGTEMLLHQGMEQFRLFTGREAPESAMRTALTQALGGTR